MSNSSFLNNLREYKKDEIKPKMNADVLKIFADPAMGDDEARKAMASKEQVLTVVCMLTISKAGSGLLQWVVAFNALHQTQSNAFHS
jgi:hypothetical protein